LKDDVEEAVRTVEKVYEYAEKLVVKWFPDVEKYNQQKRIAILSVMKMIIDVMSK